MDIASAIIDLLFKVDASLSDIRKLMRENYNRKTKIKEIFLAPRYKDTMKD